MKVLDTNILAPFLVCDDATILIGLQAKTAGARGGKQP